MPWQAEVVVARDQQRLRGLLAGESTTVAPLLLGWTLTAHSDEGSVTIALTEVEAYAGESDPASHAWRGRTPRNAVMYGEAGHLYVYRSHGLHWCANIVTGQPGTASAVLLRAGRVVDGLALARSRRQGRADHQLARGPGNVGETMALSDADNGVDLLDAHRLVLRPGDAPTAVSHGPRVGVSRAADHQWRFWVTGDPTCSAYRRSKRADPATASDSQD